MGAFAKYSNDEQCTRSYLPGNREACTRGDNLYIILYRGYAGITETREPVIGVKERKKAIRSSGEK